MNLFAQEARPPWPWQEAAWRRLCEQKQSGVLAHAYLLFGDRGTGRLDFLWEFAAFLLCGNPSADRACGQCRSCRAGGADHHPDLLRILPEEGKKDIGVEQIRELTDFLNLNSFSGQGRIALIPQAERLTLAASNALLKTLEEPAANARLLLAGYSANSLLPTIRSRCQLLRLPAPDFATALGWLRENLADRAGAKEDTSEDRLRELLQAYGNRPQELAAAVRAGQATGFVAVRKLLLALSQSRMGIVQAAREAAKIGDAAVFEHLDRISTTLTQGMLRGELRGGENTALCEALPGADQTERLRRLIAFQKQVAAVRKLLAGPGNPNPQLLLENIFRLWREPDTRRWR